MQNLIENFLAKKGQICSVTWQRSCKVKKNIPFSIEKRVCAVVRAGINYDNLNNVQEKRENGELPAENAGLPWGKWFVFPYIIEHKGEKYLRFYPFPNGEVKRVFLLDGAEVPFETVENFLLASEKQERDGDCFNVRESSVVSFK